MADIYEFPVDNREQLVMGMAKQFMPALLKQPEAIIDIIADDSKFNALIVAMRAEAIRQVLVARRDNMSLPVALQLHRQLQALNKQRRKMGALALLKQLEA